MNAGRRIAQLREEKGLSQLEFAHKVNINNSVMNRIEKGIRPIRDDELIAISKCLGVSIDYLLGNAPAKAVQQKPTGRGVRIPVLGRVVAGIPIEAVEEILDYEEITPELAATGEFFALQVKGDSMLPKLEEGDVVIVKSRKMWKQEILQLSWSTETKPLLSRLKKLTAASCFTASIRMYMSPISIPISKYKSCLSES